MTDDKKPEATAAPEPPTETPTAAPAFPTPTPDAAPAFPTPTPDAAPAATTEPATRPRPAQFGTIVWGLLLLALCGFVAISQFGPGVDADRYLWAFVGVIAAGVVLVAVGIAAAFRR